MTDIKRAISLLNKGKNTCVLVKDSLVYTSDQGGISPMMSLIAMDVDLEGFFAADKVVGRAAALLFASKGVKEVFGRVMSRSAIEIFSKYGIAFSFKTLTDSIVNRQGNGICPLEQAVAHIDSCKNVYELLRDKLYLLKRGE